MIDFLKKMQDLITTLFGLKASSFRIHDWKNKGDEGLAKYFEFPRSLDLSHTNKIKSVTQTAFLEPQNLDTGCPVIYDTPANVLK